MRHKSHLSVLHCASLCFIKKTSPYFYLLKIHHKLPKENLSKSWGILTPNTHQKLSVKIEVEFHHKLSENLQILQPIKIPVIVIMYQKGVFLI